MLARRVSKMFRRTVNTNAPCRFFRVIQTPDWVQFEEILDCQAALALEELSDEFRSEIQKLKRLLQEVSAWLRN